MIAWTHSRPAREMSHSQKPPYIDPDLRHDGQSYLLPHTGDRLQQDDGLRRARVRALGYLLLDVRIDACTGAFQLLVAVQ